jgi:hypothetical protein
MSGTTALSASFGHPAPLSLPSSSHAVLETNTMSPEAEAGPSRPTKVQDGETPKNVGRKRKAGGDGKKGKIFLEDKVSPPALQSFSRY